LFNEHLYSLHAPAKDGEGYIRLDDLEMQNDVQQKVMDIWPTITSENLAQLTDLNGYRDEFYRLFGFNINGIDYDAEVNPLVKIPSLCSEQELHDVNDTN
jgi:enoyl-[acyl-carrier protein] reductase / trans-2-enoyl-CoA reductase (NAD+)